MPFFVYILRSESTGRYYCGQTNDLNRRIREHNDAACQNTKTTKRFAGPWILIWSGEFESRAAAMRKESGIKKRGIGRFLTDETEGC